MEKCPACGAVYRGRDCCHRCKTDLSVLIRVEKQSGDCFKRAVTAFQNREYEAALLLADRSRSLKFSKKAERLRQYAAELAGAERVPCTGES
ncbi:MAG: hypothetical protein K9J83_05065 [Desulfarculaceae bacterium]|nr:hypothetical protein [Desulfarculaceae bacterium]